MPANLSRPPTAVNLKKENNSARVLRPYILNVPGNVYVVNGSNGKQLSCNQLLDDGLSFMREKGVGIREIV